MSDSEYEFDDSEAGLTSVLLGFSGKEATKGDLGVLGNHIGGTPIWLGDKQPSPDLLICNVCKKHLELLAQLSCPLPEKNYDRVLYVLTCTDPNCRRKEGSVRAIRGIESNEEVRKRIADEIAQSNPEKSLVPEGGSLGDSLFSNSGASDSNPFGQNAFSVPSNQTNNEQQTQRSTKSSKKKAKSKREMQIVKGHFVCKLLEVEEEYIELPDPQAKLEGVKIEELDVETETDAKSSGDLAVTADKEIENRSDPVFAHFVEVVESNPMQVLRYEYGLKPLLYSGTDGVVDKLKKLDKKVLEVQLMPHMISELETDDMIVDGMEWGSIFVATDEDDKLPELDDKGVGYCEEWVAVQWE